jgi:hypothetical protein
MGAAIVSLRFECRKSLSNSFTARWLRMILSYPRRLQNPRASRAKFNQHRANLSINFRNIKRRLMRQHRAASRAGGPPLRFRKGPAPFPRAPGKRTSGQMARFGVFQEKA